jgi:hypothetical protein
MRGIYEARVEMDSGAVIYIPSFIKTDSGTEKLLEGIYMQTHRHTENKVMS